MHLDNRTKEIQYLSLFFSEETTNKNAIRQLIATVCKQIFETILTSSANANGLSQLNFMEDLYLGYIHSFIYFISIYPI